METKKIAIIASAALAILVAGVVVYTTLNDGAEDKRPKQTQGSRKKKHVKRPSPRKRAQLIAERKAKTGLEKPNLSSDLDEEAKLTEEERKLLAELQAGVDKNSIRKVTQTVEKIQKLIREKGEKAVAPLLREEAVEALGWFLPESLADLIPFMADSDPDVLENVMSQFESAIDDSELGDRALSDILKSVSKVLKDDDALDALFMGIETDMRNSVAVETYIYVLENGTQEVKDRVWESVEDFTGEDDIDSPEKLKKWLEENPDDEDDEDFYGPDKDDDDDDLKEETDEDT